MARLAAGILVLSSRLIPGGPSVRRLARASLVLTLSLVYLATLFHVADGQFRTRGLGDWMDPYFINALLETWYRAAVSLTNPVSPPFFFPAPHALGYSHGLILYAPFYVPLRVFLHPFQAHTGALFLVMETGIVCLYLVLRRLQLSFPEALSLCAVFAASPNVANGTTAVWAQRASVFLIPPILLIGIASAGERGRGRLPLASLTGLLAALMYVQDFYTAQFAAFFVACFGLAALGSSAHRVFTAAVAEYRMRPRSSRMAIVAAIVLAAIACGMFMYGGGVWRVAGLKVAARDWRRPAALALSLLAILVWRHGVDVARLLHFAGTPWMRAFLAGAAAGLGVFLWIYAAAFVEHPGFSKAEVWNALADREPYPTNRPFFFAAAVTLLAWIPALRVETQARAYALWLAIISAVVWVIPLRFDHASLWTAVIGRLPGFSAIRDPKRVIYLYELAVVLATAVIAARAGRLYRRFIVVLAVGVVVLVPVHEVFDYERPNVLYDRWVAAPIHVDPACRHFFIKGASREYMSRSSDMWTLYGIDATFVALNHGLQTVNGYSAWVPPGWELRNPQEATYPGRVRAWLETSHVTDVCALDIDARTITRSP